jgi:hypothetical protein
MCGSFTPTGIPLAGSLEARDRPDRRSPALTSWACQPATGSGAPALLNWRTLRQGHRVPIVTERVHWHRRTAGRVWRTPTAEGKKNEAPGSLRSATNRHDRRKRG